MNKLSAVTARIPIPESTVPIAWQNADGIFYGYYRKFVHANVLRVNVQRMAKPIRQQLEEVYWEHRQGLFTLALSITRCHSRAEDAVHEAFTRLWKSRLSPRRDLVPYVFAAVRN